MADNEARETTEARGDEQIRENDTAQGDSPNQEANQAQGNDQVPENGTAEGENPNQEAIEAQGNDQVQENGTVEGNSLNQEASAAPSERQSNWGSLPEGGDQREWNAEPIEQINFARGVIVKKIQTDKEKLNEMASWEMFNNKPLSKKARKKLAKCNDKATRQLLKDYLCPFDDTCVFIKNKNPHLCHFRHDTNSANPPLTLPNYVCVYNLLKKCRSKDSGKCRHGLHVAVEEFETFASDEKNQERIQAFKAQFPDEDYMCLICRDNIMLERRAPRTQNFCILEGCHHVYCAKCKKFDDFFRPDCVYHCRPLEESKSLVQRYKPKIDPEKKAAIFEKVPFIAKGQLHNLRTIEDVELEKQHYQEVKRQMELNMKGKDEDDELLRTHPDYAFDDDIREAINRSLHHF